MRMMLRTEPGRIDLGLAGGARVATYRYGPDQPPGFVELRAPTGRTVTAPAGASLPAVAILHGNVDGMPFGTGEPGAGSLVVESTAARRGSFSCGFQQTISWIAPDGRSVLTSLRTIRAARAPAQGVMVDLTEELTAEPARPVMLGRTDSGLLRIALASALTPEGGGQMRNSLGGYGAEEIHDRSAAWCACVGVVEGETVGLVVLDHPYNPWHPTPWSAAANVISPTPFLWRTVYLEPEEPLVLRWRLHVHEGYVDAGWADERLAEFLVSRRPIPPAGAN